MRTNWVLVIGTSIFVLAIFSGCKSLQSHEPCYEGKRLSAWMAELFRQTKEETSYEQGWVREATWTNVVRAVGTNGLPYYLKWMVDSNDELRKYWSGHAIVILGPAAAPAIPKLADLLDKNRTSYAAARGLAAIGPAAIPAVMEIVETSTNFTQARAIEILGEFGPPAKPAVPGLILIIKSDSPMACPAMQALVEIETNQAVLLPLLALHISDTNTAAGNSAIGAAYALGRLGNAGVPMLMMMLTNETRIVRASAAAALDPDFQKYATNRCVTNVPGFQHLRIEYTMMVGRAGGRAFSQGDYKAAGQIAALYTNSSNANIRVAASNTLNFLQPLAETNAPLVKQMEGGGFTIEPEKP